MLCIVPQGEILLQRVLGRGAVRALMIARPRFCFREEVPRSVAGRRQHDCMDAGGRAKQEQLPRDAANESAGMYLRRARHRVWCWQPLRLIENLTLFSFCQCGGERPRILYLPLQYT